MRLLTRADRARLPRLYSTEGQGLQALAQVKFFTPASHWSWFAVEFDGEDLFYGLVIGHEGELGYFRLAELQAIRGLLGLPVERDRGFSPTSLQALAREHQDRCGLLL